VAADSLIQIKQLMGEFGPEKWFLICNQVSFRFNNFEIDHMIRTISFISVLNEFKFVLLHRKSLLL